MSTNVLFVAKFDASKSGLDGLTPLWDIEQLSRADGTRVALVTGGATNVIIGRRGLYGYFMTGADLRLYYYVATAITTNTTVDAKEVSAIQYEMQADLWAILGTALTETVVGYLAAAFKKLFDVAAPVFTLASINQGADNNVILSNATYGNAALHADIAAIPTTAAPTATAVADAVWEEATADHTTTGSFGAWVSSLIGSFWSFATRSLTDAVKATSSGTAGEKWSLRIGDTITQTFSGLGSIADYKSLDVIVKANKDDDTDDGAIILIRKNLSGLSDGLLRLNEVAGTAGNGSITITDSAAGNGYWTLVASDAATLAILENGDYAIKKISTGDVATTLREGKVNISRGARRATS